MAKVSGIYKIEHIPTGRCYVGQAQDVECRIKKHQGMLRRGDHHSIHLQRAWDKYGQGQFLFEVIEFCEMENLNEREQFWMDCLGAHYNRFKTAGNSRGFKLSEETKKKLSIANKGKVLSRETREKIRSAMKGRKFTPEWLAKISAARTGMKFPEEWVENLKRGWDTPKRRAGIARATAKKRGRKLTEEHKAKLREAQARRRKVLEAAK